MILQINLLHDTREKNPMLVNMLPYNEAFSRMRLSHELMKKKYPDRQAARGPAFTGLSNARPETKALSKKPAWLKELPFDYTEYIDATMPWDDQDPDLGE